MTEGARDAGKKVDKPSEQEGKGPDPKVEQEAAEAKAAEATEEAPPKKKPAPKRKPAAKKAEATAAEKTEVDKDAAEAAEATDEKPKPKRRTRAKKTEEPKGEPKEEPKAKPAPARRRNGDELVTVRAQARFVRTSARKARLVADHVRGKNVNEAMAILAFSPRSVAEDWTKVLKSAIANAEHNHDLVGDDLRILNATADEGPTLKRYRPRAMGRATRIRKRTSHLTITLTPKD